MRSPLFVRRVMAVDEDYEEMLKKCARISIGLILDLVPTPY